MWGKWGTPQNFLLAFIDELWKTRKIKFLKKMKTFAGDIIILQMCTKNHNHMRCSSWDTKWDRIFYHFGPFFALLTPFPLTTQKTKILNKWKKHLGMSLFWTCATKNTIIWRILTQTWSACTGISFCYFRPFFALLLHYIPQKIKFGKNVKKHLEKLPFYTCVPIIKIICTPDMMYASWDMKFNRQIYSAILGNFSPFYMKISKQWKNSLDVSLFYTSVPKIMIRCYTVSKIWHVLFFILGNL